MRIRTDIGTHGPWFNGEAQRAITAYCDSTRDVLANYAENLVHSELHQVLQHPTGYYEAHIRTEQQSFEAKSVNDMGVIYGPWLEGTGSRNYPRTRFRGYATFRRVTQKVNKDAKRIAKSNLSRFIGRMQ